VGNSLQSMPGGPRLTQGRRFTVSNGWSAVVAPEFYGETAVRSNFSGQTSFEGLLAGRLERTGDKRHLRFRVGIGHGLVQNFGAPEWRILVGVELVGQRPVSTASKP
jgi:hypothetical protein